MNSSWLRNRQLYAFKLHVPYSMILSIKLDPILSWASWNNLRAYRNEKQKNAQVLAVVGKWGSNIVIRWPFRIGRAVSSSLQWKHHFPCLAISHWLHIRSIIPHLLCQSDLMLTKKITCRKIYSIKSGRFAGRVPWIVIHLLPPECSSIYTSTLSLVSPNTFQTRSLYRMMRYPSTSIYQVQWDIHAWSSRLSVQYDLVKWQLFTGELNCTVHAQLSLRENLQRKSAIREKFSRNRAWLAFWHHIWRFRSVAPFLQFDKAL